MAKKKIYAVKKGKQTGLFTSWEACKMAVEGFPGAEYKGFTDIAEAKTYLFGTAAADPAAQEGLRAYVDGSYDGALPRYSFGCVLILPDGRIIEKSGSGSQPESLAIRNVAGEMLGAMYAVLWAYKNGFERLEICYDYAGIEKWALGEWQAKNDLTKKYAAFMRGYLKQMHIRFKKIAAHTGDFYNEKADRLAKAALKSDEGIPKAEKEI